MPRTVCARELQTVQHNSEPYRLRDQTYGGRSTGPAGNGMASHCGKETSGSHVHTGEIDRVLPRGRALFYCSGSIHISAPFPGAEGSPNRFAYGTNILWRPVYGSCRKRLGLPVWKGDPRLLRNPSCEHPGSIPRGRTPQTTAMPGFRADGPRRRIRTHARRNQK